MTKNERFGLVFTKTGSVNSGTGVFRVVPIQYEPATTYCLFVRINRIETYIYIYGDKILTRRTRIMAAILE
jgi:hypothetical protein